MTYHPLQQENAIFDASSKKRINFTQEEDNYLIQLVQENGIENWKKISILLTTKNSGQCENRWNYHLNPSINQRKWTEEEDMMLIANINQIGKKWVKISKLFFHRTDAQCKNRFKQLQRKIKKDGKIKEEFDFIPSSPQHDDKNNQEIISTQSPKN
jgi:hypothetical protein